VWGRGILEIIKASERVVGEARAYSIDEVRALGGPPAFRTLLWGELLKIIKGSERVVGGPEDGG